MLSSTLVAVLTIVVLNGASTWASPSSHLINTARDSVSNDNAYTGTGGQANGGSVNGAGDDGFLVPLLDIFSNTAGSGGEANSGNSFGGLGRRGSSESDGNSYTGTGGQAGGGNIYNAPGLVNVAAANAGPGGNANSGAAGDLPPPSNAHSHHHTGSAHGHHPRSNSVSNGNAYTGVGGQANGGAVNDGPDTKAPLLSSFAGNAGSGGHASSGDAYGAGARPFGHPWGRKRDSVSNNNAYTGNGGQANGGDVQCGDGEGLPTLLNLFSDNAGDGGEANSGNAAGGSRRDNSEENGNAYTGTGGQANGGSVSGDCGLINLFSGNAGNGGWANSGSAEGGH